MRYSFFLLSLFLSCVCFGEDVNYAVSAIPKDLLKNANVVKRIEEVRFEIINTGETVYYQKYALTILNEAGSRYAQFYQGYEKLIQVRSIEGALYDANGKQLKKLKNKDVQDVSGVSDNNLFDDNRVKAHNFYFAAYPYTVEYEVEVKFNNSLFFPSWMPQDAQNLAVEKSRFTVVYPSGYKIRHRAVNCKSAPVVSDLKNKKQMMWEAQNILAMKRPYASPKWSELTTVVYLAASEFEIEGYKGNMETWADFGKFQSELNKGRDELPADLVQKVQQLTAGISDQREKVKALYQFLQQNTRYISIQLGIGGWQPFNASYVAQKGYGDCKALTNYMYSLLKAAGIKSNYCLVSAGDDTKNHQLMEDFPSSQFNHVILCVPFAKDSMWLECTNQTLRAGYMGEFTGNRKALLIDEQGGKVVSTPRYRLKDNLQIRSIKGIVSPEGNLNVNLNTVYTGMQQDNLHGMLNYLSKDKVKKVLNEQLNLSTYDINDFKYSERQNSLPEINEQLDIYVSNYATVSGKRLFITPNLINRSDSRFTEEEERVYDFVFDYEYRDVDTVEIEIPAGYVVEALPQDVALKNKFGMYSSGVKLVENTLYYLRIREQYAGRYPPKDKEELSKFFEAMYKADRGRVVLVKKTD
jgi:hypothetical protein